MTTSQQSAPSPDQVRRWLDMASDAIREVEDTYESISDPDDALALLYELAAIKRHLGDVYKKVEAHCPSLMGSKRIAVAPYGEFESKRDTKRTGWRWRPKDDKPGLVDVIVARCADDFTGEPPAVFAAFVADELAACIGFSSGKVRGLEARGLSAGDFCIEEPQGWRIQLPAAVNEEAA